MDARLRSAQQCLQELRGAPTMEACHAAAVLAGVSLIDADECDGGTCCCPRCPWRRSAANWRARTDSANFQGRS
jgi:Fe-S-cluster-containing dehydrogenase component